MRSQIIHRQRMCFLLAQQLAPPCFSQTSPPVTSPLSISSSLQGRTVPFPAQYCPASITEPRLQVDVIRLEPDATIAYNPSSSRKSIRTCITPCCPVGWRGLPGLPHGVDVDRSARWLWDRQLGALTGWRQETDFTARRSKWSN